MKRIDEVPGSNAVIDKALAALGTAGGKAMLGPVECALQHSPGDFRLWHVRGLIERQANHHERAIVSLRRATELAPDEAIVAHGLARTLFEAGLDSIDAYGRALQLAPGDPDIIAGLTAALVSDGRSADAIAGLERIVARSPAWVAGHKLIADLRWVAGERKGFARSFDAALASRPDDVALRREQLRSLLHAEQYDAALAAVVNGRAAVGEDPLFDANEAVCRSELGQSDLADAMFQRHAAIDDPSFQVRRVRHFLRTGRPQAALSIIERGISGADAASYWPYAATAWRMAADPRWQWLEGDDNLVRTFDIADRLPPLEQVAATLRALHTVKGQPLEQSVRGGSQTDGNLFMNVDPVLVALREAVRGAVGEYIAQLGARDATHPLLGPRRDTVNFSGAWSVRLTGGGFHANHVHPQGWISSALYVALPEPDAGDPQAGWLKLGEPDERLGLGLAPARTVEPRAGRLVLFPSTMWHGTRAFAAGERLTVAFDVARPQ